MRASIGTPSRLVEQAMPAGTALLRLIDEIIKGRDAVRLGPHADGAWPGDVVVVQFDVSLSIKYASNPRTGKFGSQRVPHVAGDRCVDILDLLPAASLGVVERDIALQGVGPGDVVIFPISPSPDNAPALIL